MGKQIIPSLLWTLIIVQPNAFQSFFFPPLPQVNSWILINAQRSTKPKIKVDPSAHFCSFLCFTSGTHSSVLCLQITATLAFSISNSSLQLRESPGLCLEFPSLHYRLEIAFRQESGTIRMLTSFVSLLSGITILCCLFPIFVEFHFIYFVSFFSCWGWECKSSLLLYHD